MPFALRAAAALTLFVALASSPSRAGLPAPMDRLSWLVGTWSCATPSGTPLAYKQTFALAGNGLAQNFTLDGSPLSGLIGFDGKQFIYTSSTKMRDTAITQRMSAPPASVSATSFEFTGTVSAGGKSDKERWTGKLSGKSEYTDRAFAFAGGEWRQILEVVCKRV
jgi:hypothetical protein